MNAPATASHLLPQIHLREVPQALIEALQNRFGAQCSLAQAVRALPGDCHVPSRGESALLYATLEAQFEPGWYWTSTQSSANYAFIQYFDYGLQYGHGKGYEGRCRAVRRLVLESFNPLMAAR